MMTEEMTVLYVNIVKETEVAVSFLSLLLSFFEKIVILWQIDASLKYKRMYRN